MPKPRPPHLCREETRHGRVVWFVRRYPGPRIRITVEYGSQEFWEQYNLALAGKLAHAKDRSRSTKAGSLRWLWDRYRETTAWSDLSAATRRQRENIIGHVLTKHGDMPFPAVTQQHVVAGRDARKDTPAQARNFLDALRGLFRWAFEKQHVKVDPTSNVKNPKRPKTEGFKSWTEEDVQKYEMRWPIGTKERVWLDVLLYTGLRRGDAVRLGKQHVRNAEATIRTEKSGGEVEVTLPILPVLQKTLDAGPTGDLTFICGERRQPLTKESFGNMFKEACVTAGVNEGKKSAHGLRKVACNRAADNGATEAQMDALFGWRGGGMAALYTRKANRKRMSRAAIRLIERNGE